MSAGRELERDVLNATHYPEEFWLQAPAVSLESMWPSHILAHLVAHVGQHTSHARARVRPCPPRAGGLD
jgi:hypothetical protein